jgi:hypothetical protein
MAKKTKRETWIRYPAHTKNGAITSSRIVDVDKRKCRAQFPPVETTTFGVCVLNYLTPDEPALNIQGTLIYEKNLKSKISCQIPFKGTVK